MEENQHLLAQAREHAFLKGVIACVDLGDPKLGNWLDVLQRQACFRGVWGRDLETGQAGRPDREGLGLLEERGIPLDLAAPGAGLPAFLERHPDLRVAITHLGMPDGSESWFGGMELAAQSPRVAVKASRLLAGRGRPWSASAVRPFVAHVLRVFGPRRVMFGSDWPSCLPDSIWKETLAIFTQAIGAQDMETREWLLGESACAFYGIEGAKDR